MQAKRHFMRQGHLLMVTQRDGPSYNYLQLELAETMVSPSVEVFSTAGPEPTHPLDAALVLRYVVTGVDAANRLLGTSYRFRVARFTPFDARPESTYQDLAFALIEHLARGAPFDQVGPPVPKTYRDTKDQFAFLALGAPDFRIAQKAVTYTLTVEMVVNSLLQGINGLARRTQKEEAKRLFEQSALQIQSALEFFKQDRITEGKRMVYAAEQTFASAGKSARGKRPSDLWVEKE